MLMRLRVLSHIRIVEPTEIEQLRSLPIDRVVTLDEGGSRLYDCINNIRFHCCISY